MPYLFFSWAKFNILFSLRSVHTFSWFLKSNCVTVKLCHSDKNNAYFLLAQLFVVFWQSNHYSWKSDSKYLFLIRSNNIDWQKDIPTLSIWKCDPFIVNHYAKIWYVGLLGANYTHTIRWGGQTENIRML